MPITSTYKPSYIPPQPVAPVSKKEPEKVDVSRVASGMAVKHKAFGDGIVKELTSGMDGKNYCA